MYTSSQIKICWISFALLCWLYYLQYHISGLCLNFRHTLNLYFEQSNLWVTISTAGLHSDTTKFSQNTSDRSMLIKLQPTYSPTSPVLIIHWSTFLHYNVFRCIKCTNGAAGTLVAVPWLSLTLSVNSKVYMREACIYMHKHV